MSIRRLTDDEKAELKALNDGVEAAIAARTAWLDAKMLEVSSIKPGDELYDLWTGRPLGTVTELYRYWAHQNKLLDTSLSIDYRYEAKVESWMVGSDTDFKYIDNTSRKQLYLGDKAEAAESMRARAESDLRRASEMVAQGAAP